MLSTSFQALIDDFDKYKTTKTYTHSGDLLEHSSWTAYYVNDLFTNLDMMNPLHDVWNKVIVDDFDNKSGFMVDVKKVLIISAFLHDIGKGGDNIVQFYEKPDHENIGARYFELGTYYTVDNTSINIKEMIKDFGLNRVEVEIMSILIKGHLLLGNTIDKIDGHITFVELVLNLYEESNIGVFNKYLFSLVVMMQLIICIADVMAMKEYKGHSKSIDLFPQIERKNASHESTTNVFKDYNYDDVISTFVPEVYGYIFDTFINKVSDGNNVIINAINNIDTIDFEKFELEIEDVFNEDIDDDNMSDLIEGSIYKKRFDILAVLIVYIDTSVRMILNELLDNSLLDDFILYIRSSTNIKEFMKNATIKNLLQYIIENSISEGIIPFITSHKSLLGMQQLIQSKNVYKTAMESGNNTFEAKQIFNEIKGAYSVPTGFYKSDKHRLYCESIDYDDFPEPLILDSKKIIFRIPSIMRNFKIGYLNDITMANQTVDIMFKLTKDNYGGGTSSLFGDDFTLDIDWVYNSIKYINNLSIEDKFTVLGYTHNGDELVNNYLLGNNPKLKNLIDHYYYKGEPEKYNEWFLPIFFQIKKIIMSKRRDIIIDKTNKLFLPKLRSFINNSVLSETYEHLLTKLKLFTYDFYVDCIRMYSEDLKRIINNSPSMTKTSILYRGVKDKYYYTDPSNKIFKTTTFMSTSYNPESAIEFSGRKCCFKKIIATPGTKGLFIEAITSHTGEFEVLLNTETKFNIIEDKVKFTSDKKDSFEDICDTGLRNMEITTMEVVV
jgi:hypothetical protein